MLISATQHVFRVMERQAAATSSTVTFLSLKRSNIQSSVIIPKKLEITSVWVDLPTPLLIAQLVHGHHHFTWRVVCCAAH